MKTVTMYSTDWCPYCRNAKSFLAQKGIPVEEIDLTNDDAGRESLVERSGRRTVPQMYVGDVHIGGYDDLRALDRSGGLMPLVSAG